MRYCFTEAAKAEITIEITIADFRDLREAVTAAAAAPDSSYRVQMLADQLTGVQHDVVDAVHRYATELQRQLRGEI